MRAMIEKRLTQENAISGNRVVADKKGKSMSHLYCKTTT